MYSWLIPLQSIRLQFAAAAAERNVSWFKHCIVKVPEHSNWWEVFQFSLAQNAIKPAHRAIVFRMFECLRDDAPDDASDLNDRLYLAELREGEVLHLCGEADAVDRCVNLCAVAGRAIPPQQFPSHPIIELSSCRRRPERINPVELWVRFLYQQIEEMNADWIDRRLSIVRTELPPPRRKRKAPLKDESPPPLMAPVVTMIPDLFTASVAAIDWLLGAPLPTPREPPAPPRCPPMSKASMRVRAGNITQRSFKTWVTPHDLQPAGSSQRWTIRVDQLDDVTRAKFLRA